MRSLTAAFLIALALPGLPAYATDADVAVSGTAFTPATVTITVGDRVMWTGETGHTITPDDDGETWGEAQFDGRYAHTFAKAGAFGYHCRIHGTPGRDMHGTVVVKAAPSPSVSPSASPSPRRSPSPSASPSPSRSRTPAAVSPSPVRTVSPSPSRSRTPAAVSPSPVRTASPSPLPTFVTPSPVTSDLLADLTPVRDRGGIGPGAAMTIALLLAAVSLGGAFWLLRR